MKNTLYVCTAHAAVEAEWNRIRSWSSNSVGDNVWVPKLVFNEVSDRSPRHRPNWYTHPTSVWPEKHPGQTTRDHEKEAAVTPKLLAAHYQPGIRTFVSCQILLISTAHVLHERSWLTCFFTATCKDSCAEEACEVKLRRGVINHTDLKHMQHTFSELQRREAERSTAYRKELIRTNRGEMSLFHWGKSDAKGVSSSCWVIDQLLKLPLPTHFGSWSILRTKKWLLLSLSVRNLKLCTLKVL